MANQPEKWRVVVPPTALPVSVAAAANHLRLEENQFDTTHMTLLINAAADFAEDSMSIALMQRTILASYYDGQPIVLPRGPLIEVESVKDKDDVAVTDFNVTHVGYRATIVPDRPIAYPVTVRYTAGHASATQIPASVRLALLAHVGTLNAHRQTVNERTKTAVPHSLDDFYRLKRRAVSVS